ncbi:MAG: heparinase II/III family protein [Promethearchaeota archaeon]
MKRLPSKRLILVIFSLLGILLTTGSIFILTEKSYLLKTPKKTIARSIWFIHPTDERPAIVIVRDHYESYNPDENFTLLVHGLGDMNISERGAIWSRGVQGIQVEIFNDNLVLTEKEGYNAEFESMEPYLEVNFGDKGLIDIVWLAIVIKNNKTVPYAYQNKQVIINNSLIISIPENDKDKLIIDSSYGSKSPFEFCGDIFIEANDSNPFVMGANIYDLTKEPASLETFEFSDNERILAEQYTVEWELDKNITILSILEENEIETILNKLPEIGPCLYTNDSERNVIKNRLIVPPNTIYNLLSKAINHSAKVAMSHNFNNGSIENVRSRPPRARDLAFHAWLYEDPTEVLQVYKLMEYITEHILRYYEQPSMLWHGIYLADYAIAWDFAQSMFNTSQETKIRENMILYGQFVRDYLPVCGKNNWETVVSSGVGLAGLKLKDSDMIRVTLEKLDHYLTENVRIEGGIFEGQDYIGFAFDSYKRFMIACAQHESLGLPNYFKDGRFQSIFQFFTRCITPDGFFPLFEDANPSTSGSTNGFIVAPFFSNANNTQLAKELVWAYNFHDVNSTSQSIEKILFANYSIIPSEPILPEKYDSEEIYTGASYVAQDSGLAMFRNNWSTNSAYLTTSAKTFDQSHVHYDEFSFEFWANGIKLLANPGYPGWKQEHYLWTTSTRASNGGVLFSGKGQTKEDCSTGIVQWLRGKYIDYIQMNDDNLYSPPFWDYSRNYSRDYSRNYSRDYSWDYFWLIIIWSSLGIAFIITGYMLIKRRTLLFRRKENFN